jgi:predicted transcriptional regulator YheO
MNTLQTFMPIVSFLGQVLGPHCEVVLYDLTQPAHSVIALANGHVSAEKLDGPSPDHIPETIKAGSPEQPPFYTTCINGGTRRFSTFLIRESNKIIGALCINADLRPFTEIRRLLDVLAPAPVSPATGNPAEPDSDKEESVMTIIDKVLNTFAVLPNRMSLEEKITAVRYANKNGLFSRKGGVSALARRLHVSEPTLYRYLNRIKEEK